MEVSSHTHAPADLLPGKKPTHTHWTRGQVFGSDRDMFHTENVSPLIRWTCYVRFLCVEWCFRYNKRQLLQWSSWICKQTSPICDTLCTCLKRVRLQKAVRRGRVS